MHVLPAIIAAGGPLWTRIKAKKRFSWDYHRSWGQTWAKQKSPYRRSTRGQYRHKRSGRRAETRRTDPKKPKARPACHKNAGRLNRNGSLAKWQAGLVTGCPGQTERRDLPITKREGELRVSWQVPLQRGFQKGLQIGRSDWTQIKWRNHPWHICERSATGLRHRDVIVRTLSAADRIRVWRAGNRRRKFRGPQRE